MNKEGAVRKQEGNTYHALPEVQESALVRLGHAGLTKSANKQPAPEARLPAPKLATLPNATAPSPIIPQVS